MNYLCNYYTIVVWCSIGKVSTSGHFLTSRLTVEVVN